MINASILMDMYAHMRWADAQVWSAVTAHRPAAEDQKMKELLEHIHIVQKAFLMLWRGEDITENMPRFDDLASVLKWAKPCYGEAIEHIEAIGEEGLSVPVNMKWAAMIEKQIGRRPEAVTTGETALQVAMHSTHHRGQVNARLRELGGEPPTVDYIIWLWSGRPEPEWPSTGGDP